MKELETELLKLKTENQKLVEVYETTLKRLEDRLTIVEELRESKERFVTIFNESQVAYKMINRNLKMIQLNQALSDLLGYTKEELLGTTILQYTHPDFVDKWYDLHEALWNQALPSFQLEACLVRKDKTEVWCLVNTIRFIDKGETLGYTSLVDISARKQLERHKDEFISTVSHELKTPLASIKAYSQVLLRHFETKGEDQPKVMLKRMEAKVSSLTTLIEDLVMASRIERGKLSLKTEEYRLDELVCEVVEEFQTSVITREFICTSEKDLKVEGDKYKITQVIENLLNNAMKFSRADTPIFVTVKKQGKAAIVCIKDSGCGVSEESIKNIFDRFFKVKEAESNNESGMGLGLYICKEIIKSQQGKLWVNSKLGKGSSFCFSLPLIS